MLPEEAAEKFLAAPFRSLCTFGGETRFSSALRMKRPSHLRASLSALLLIWLPLGLAGQGRPDSTAAPADSSARQQAVTAGDSAQAQADQLFEETNRPHIQWEPTLAKAIDKAFVQNKKVLVYIYADWCGFCKLMERKALRNREVIRYINQRYVPVMLNAMSKDEVWFMGSSFKYDEEHHINELAYVLMEGDLQFPTWIVMNRQTDILSPIVGYQKAQTFLKALRYYGEEIYITTTWEEFDGNYQQR